ncbi:MAG: flavin reductase family protein [Gemmatimonadota bacterium]|nr:flavin reductase family protein [Gemmatimonadota bacterium]
MSELSTDATRVALRALTHGVYVLSVGSADTQTTADGQLTAVDDYLVMSLVMQCSVQPPRVAFAVCSNARLLPALRVNGGGVLSTLDETQSAAVRRYGVPGGVRRVPIGPARSPHGHPIPPEASHWIEFRTVTETIVGDHLLFVADVTAAGVSNTLVAPNQTLAGSVESKFAPLTLASSGFPYAG